MINILNKHDINTVAGGVLCLCHNSRNSYSGRFTYVDTAIDCGNWCCNPLSQDNIWALYTRNANNLTFNVETPCHPQPRKFKKSITLPSGKKTSAVVIILP